MMVSLPTRRAATARESKLKIVKTVDARRNTNGFRRASLLTAATALTTIEERDVDESAGKQIRLSRLFSIRDGRAVVFAFDHGMQVGPVPGTVDLRAGVALAVEAGFDGIILSPGALADGRPIC